MVKIPYIILFVIVAIIIQGCAPSSRSIVKSYKRNSYNIAYDNAIKASRDIGLNIINADKKSGIIFGQKNLDDVSIAVLEDGGDVKINVTLTGNYPLITPPSKIADDFYKAYDRYQKNKR